MDPICCGGGNAAKTKLGPYLAPIAVVALQFGFHYTMAGFEVYFGEVMVCVAATALCGAVCLFRKRLAAWLNTIVIAYLIVEIPWETRVVFSSYFTKKEAKVYARFHLRFAFLTAALCAAAWGAAKAVGLGGWPGLAAKGAVASVATIVILFAVFRQDVIRLVGRISGDRWKSSL